MLAQANLHEYRVWFYWKSLIILIEVSEATRWTPVTAYIAWQDVHVMCESAPENLHEAATHSVRMGFHWMNYKFLQCKNIIVVFRVNLSPVSRMIEHSVLSSVVEFMLHKSWTVPGYSIPYNLFSLAISISAECRVRPQMHSTNFRSRECLIPAIPQPPKCYTSISSLRFVCCCGISHP